MKRISGNILPKERQCVCKTFTAIERYGRGNCLAYAGHADQHSATPGKLGKLLTASPSVDVIDPLYGTTSDFENFVTKAHEMGMKVIIDWVANHTGYDHQWTTKYPEFYHKDEGGNFTGLHGWIDVIDLNYTIPAMRAEMIASMKHWIHKFDIDGFRCDMARTVPLDFWLEARAESIQ